MTALAESGASPGRIRVVHCVGFYFPDPAGGTEVYVQDLVLELARRAIDSCVVAATDQDFREYECEGVEVSRYQEVKLVGQISESHFVISLTDRARVFW